MRAETGDSLKLGDGIVELGRSDRVVIVRLGRALQRFAADEFTPVAAGDVHTVLHAAAIDIDDARFAEMWRALFRWDPPASYDRYAICDAIAQCASGLCATLAVFESRSERGRIVEAAPWPEPAPGPQRTVDDHWIVVEAVDEQDTPVPGVRFELLIAGGETMSLYTDAQGRARADRIKAGRVVLSLPEIDKSLWEPLDGATPEPSHSDARLRWHTVAAGECLSRIAHRYGLKSYEALWNHPKNAELRKKRASPHVLRPGDLVAVVGVQVGEIVRATDATCRVRVRRTLVEFRVVLQDHNQYPFSAEPYEFWTEPALAEGRRSGVTDSKGKVVEKVSPAVREVRVRLPQRRLTWAFATASLQPPAARSEYDGDSVPPASIWAIQQRLNALGFPCGVPDGIFGPLTRAALARFKGGEAEPNDDTPLASADVESVVNAYSV